MPHPDGSASDVFRADVRRFIAENLPADLRAKVLGFKRLEREDWLRWHRILHARGWAAPSWPKEFGGTGWSAVQQHIFDEECGAAGAPPLLGFGLRMVAPVLMAFGSREQQEYFLPRILSGEQWWCQGYSEPGSGSDLASLKTRAERRGDHYVVNGQKTWTTLAHFAEWIFCLVRTDSGAKPQSGISFLLIDMNTPGITVRPIELLDGEREVNEVWFENVQVPVANRVGEENAGWTYAKYLLGHERAGFSHLGAARRELAALRDFAARRRRGAGRLIDDPRFRDRLAEVEIEMDALEVTTLRVLAERGDPGAAASVIKICGSEIQQALAELAMQALGPMAVADIRDSLDVNWRGEPRGAEEWGPFSGRYFNMRKTSIYSGSNEIQRNIITRRILGL
jgi:alkylation response protein AidB-like acyl-CoA dehydrogenase